MQICIEKSLYTYIYINAFQTIEPFRKGPQEGALAAPGLRAPNAGCSEAHSPGPAAEGLGRLGLIKRIHKVL